MNTALTPIALAGLALYGEDADILRGINRYTRLVGNWIVETAAHDVREFSPTHLHRPAAGVIAHIASPEMGRIIEQMKVPVVNISGVIPDRLPFHHVGVDQYRVGTFAAEQLLNLGLRHFALPMTEGQIPHAYLNQRVRGFLDRLAEQGITEYYCLSGNIEFPYGKSTPSHGDSSTFRVRKLAELPRPCGIFALNDRIGIAINEECLDEGIRVPEEISILGAGNLEILCEFAHPTLSSIDPPMEGVGFEAARTLHLLLQGHSPPRSQLLPGPVRLVPRASSSQIMVEDALVRQALTFIRDHARKGINVADVADYCQGTRRNLEIRFRTVTGESILDRIHRVRLSLARELLENSREPISVISSSCGYSNPEHMSRSFKRYLGKSPRELRHAQERP